MGRMKLLERANGATVEGFCIIKSVAVRTDSKGQDYVDFVLSDGGGECAAKLWSYTKYAHGDFSADEIIKVRGTLQYWKDTEQIKIERIRRRDPGDPVDMSQLIPCAPYPPEAMYDELFSMADDFTNSDLKSLVQYLLQQNREALLIAPAAVKLHHATRGGLLHHSLSVARLGAKICELYPKLNRDLVLSGAILHDIGKLKELEISALGIAGAYATAGQLIGHINIGAAMIDEAAKKLNILPETAMTLEHMILSHHGKPEFGSPKLPMFPEAEVLSECDNIDSKLYEMFDALDGVASMGFSERIWALDNRQLYKHDLNGPNA